MKNIIGSELTLGIFALVTLGAGLGACGKSSESSSASVAGKSARVGPVGLPCPGSQIDSSMTSNDFAGRCQSAFMAWQTRASGSTGPTTGPNSGTALTLAEGSVSGSLDQKFSKFCAAMKSWKTEAAATDPQGRYSAIADKAVGCTAKFQSPNLLMAIDSSFRSTNDQPTGAEPDVNTTQSGDQPLIPTNTGDYR